MRLFSLSFAIFGLCVALPVSGNDHAQCVGCHQESGFSGNPLIPTIGGQDSFVLTDWLFAFQDEARPCDAVHPDGSTANHCDLVADMSEGEMEELGETYAAQSWKVAPQETDAALAATGKEIHDAACEKCHVDNGRDAEYGILAGQWVEYLEKAHNDYINGVREIPSGMEGIKSLNANQAKALAHFYGSQGG